VLKAVKEHKVPQDQLDLKAFKVPQDPQVPQDQLDQLAHKEQVGQQLIHFQQMQQIKQI
jgi:hypothetical protein